MNKDYKFLLIVFIVMTTIILSLFLFTNFFEQTSKNECIELCDNYIDFKFETSVAICECEFDNGTYYEVLLKETQGIK